ncbi:MAG: type II secretion system protein GspM [Bryobacteraceae bacterium]|jgi:hypothetical protein
MTISPRVRRVLAGMAAIEVVALLYTYWPASTTHVVAASVDSVGFAEKRLAKLRDTAATVPEKEEIAKKVSSELAIREKGLITADTAPQAQAQLIQIIRRLGAAEAPPIEIRATELGGIVPFGDSYGQASVSVQIECPIDQLINLLASLGSQPELISTTDLRINPGNPKDKTVGVRLTVSGIVPRKLVPEKKGGTAF